MRADLPQYPRTMSRMRRDAVALRRAVAKLQLAMRLEADGLAGQPGQRVDVLSWEVARLAHCVSADAQEMNRVALARMHMSQP